MATVPGRGGSAKSYFCSSTWKTIGELSAFDVEEPHPRPFARGAEVVRIDNYGPDSTRGQASRFQSVALPGGSTSSAGTPSANSPRGISGSRGLVPTQSVAGVVGVYRTPTQNMCRLQGRSTFDTEH